MKKKITLLLGVAWIACTLSAQNTLKLADYEDGQDCFTLVNQSGTKEIFNNPSPNTVNSSLKVLKIDFPALSSSQYSVVYVNNYTATFIPIGTEQDQYRYLHLKLYMPFSSTVEWQFRENTSGKGFCNVANTVVDEWTYIIMDLMVDAQSTTCSVPAALRGGAVFNGFMLCPDKYRQNNGLVAYTAYVDDIYLSDSDTPISNAGPGTGIADKAVKKSGISVARSLSGNSTVLVNETSGNLKLEIFNLQGQLVKEVYNGPATSAGSYELPALTQGIHILKATTSSGVSSIKF